MEERKHIIVAPHGDDEIIGCHSVLESGGVRCVAFPTEREQGGSAIRSSQEFDFQIITFDDQKGLFEALVQCQLDEGFLFFPDPTYELHPDHRKWGNIGAKFVVDGCSNVIFYSTNMNAPYIREVPNPVAKQNALNTCYPEKEDLWKYDHKYFLFEGQCKWITKWDD